MGHTWKILCPSAVTLPKKTCRWKKYEGTLIRTIGSFFAGSLTLHYTLEELKSFENAGCGVLYDGRSISSWESFYREIAEFPDYQLARKVPNRKINVPGVGEVTFVAT